MSWQEIARENYFDLKDIPPEKASRDQFVLYAACIALEGHMPPSKESVSPGIEAEPQNASVDVRKMLEYANNELEDSELYYSLYIDTKDKKYKEFALDELAHSEYWMKKAKESGEVPESDFQECVIYHNSLLAKLA